MPRRRPPDQTAIYREESVQPMTTKVRDAIERPAEPLATAAETQWGVRYRGHRVGERLSVSGVDECEDRPAALALRERLLFCGNNDAELVARAGDDAAWVAVGGVA